ncbi:hypothetical protein DFH28DRAFT_1152643 [Melampsora americana]|nr:hypothetical protein DFH28DRAFT_1152643 [Melampsora americana]
MRIIPIHLEVTRSKQSQDHHTHQQNSRVMVSPANIARVPSVMTQESRPQVSHATIKPSARPLTHPNQVTGTRPEVQAPKTSQKRNSGRRPIASTSTTTTTSTPTQAPTTTTRAIVNLFLPNSLRGERECLQGTPLNLPTPEDMMNKSSVDLRIIASKHAKGSTVPAAKQKLFMPSGVASGEASTFASIKWNEMSKEEQDSYKAENHTVNTSSNTIDSAPQADTKKEPIYHNARAKKNSLASARLAVTNFMINSRFMLTILCIEARDIAATYEGDFAIIGVSNYLGNDAYQIARGTPRALKWLDNDRVCNPRKHIAAQLQSYVTGTEAGLLNSSKAKVDDRTKCREALSDLISMRTRRAFEKWPWKGCQEKLAAKGYVIQFAPDSKSQANDIMQESNQLTPTQARDVLADLSDNKITILETEAGPIRNAKRKRNHSPDDTPLATSPAVTPTAANDLAEQTPLLDSNTASTTGNTPIADNRPSTTADIIDNTLVPATSPTAFDTEE